MTAICLCREIVLTGACERCSHGYFYHHDDDEGCRHHANPVRTYVRCTWKYGVGICQACKRVTPVTSQASEGQVIIVAEWDEAGTRILTTHCRKCAPPEALAEYVAEVLTRDGEAPEAPDRYVMRSGTIQISRPSWTTTNGVRISGPTRP